MTPKPAWPICDNDWRHAFQLQEFRDEATLLTHRADSLGIALNVRRVIREVRDGKEICELGEDFAFVVRTPGSRLHAARSSRVTLFRL